MVKKEDSCIIFNCHSIYTNKLNIHKLNIYSVKYTRKNLLFYFLSVSKLNGEEKIFVFTWTKL